MHYHFRRLLRIYRSSFAPSASISLQRPASLPFITGDLFRSLSHYCVEFSCDLQDLYNIFSRSTQIPNSFRIFFSVSFLENENNRRDVLAFFYWLRVLSEDIRLTVLIHNGDLIPPGSFFVDLASFCEAVFCVNYLERSDVVKPLPIGLENLHLLNGGLIEDFRMANSLRVIGVSQERSVPVLCAFNESTNPLVREPLIRFFCRSQYSSRTRYSLKQYRLMLARSMFCLSPPGNGPDCHRTWEAIYHGSVPVVHRDYFHPELSSVLPVHVVSSYEEFLSLSVQDLIDLYKTYFRLKCDAIYAPYWIRKVS